jgi:hypothetical protein
VRPGDELHIESEVLEVRASKSLSNQDPIKVGTTTLNQNNEAVQVQIANLIVLRRQSGEVGYVIEGATSIGPIPNLLLMSYGAISIHSFSIG